MVDRDMLEVDNSVGRFKSYKLADNSIVNKLIAIDIEHNLVTSDMPGKDTLIEQQEPENPVKRQLKTAIIRHLTRLTISGLTI